MALKDVSERRIEEDLFIFACLFNLGCLEADIIDPYSLSNFESDLNSIIENKSEDPGNKTGLTSFRRYRDISRAAVAKQDDKSVYMVLCLENQSKVDPFMPRRVMNYDSLTYEEQEKNWIHSGRRGEFKYKPVYTLVINFSGHPWNAPKSLHEMMELSGLPEYMIPNDYRIKVLDPAKMTQEELERYPKPLRHVWELLRRFPNTKDIGDYITEHRESLLQENEDFQHLYAAITQRRFPDLPIEQENESGNEPKKERSLEEMIDGVASLQQFYFDNGRKAGFDDGRKAGREEEKIEEEKRRRESALILLKDLVNPETVAKSLKLPLSEVLELQKTL